MNEIEKRDAAYYNRLWREQRILMDRHEAERRRNVILEPVAPVGIIAIAILVCLLILSWL